MKKSTIALLMAIATLSANGQSTTQSAAPAKSIFDFEASYVGDTYYNARGGLQTGGGFMGMANMKMGVNAWRGGRFFLNGASIHGKSLSCNYLGDMQVASNIDAGEFNYLHEMWFKQQFGNFTFTIGLQDMNVDFMNTSGGGEFLNSSFGVPPVLATGARAAIFPATGLGVQVQWNISKKWRAQLALFDGKQTDLADHNSHNVHWCLSRAEGALAMAEVHYDNRLKLGAFYHTAHKNYGIYLLADQPFSERMSLFGQFAYAPKKELNENNYSFGLGVNWLAAERHQLGAALTTAGLHQTGEKHETALEVYYRYTLSDNITLQPDVQYIIAPSGDHNLRNALVGIMRVAIIF